MHGRPEGTLRSERPVDPVKDIRPFFRIGLLAQHFGGGTQVMRLETPDQRAQQELMITMYSSTHGYLLCFILIQKSGPAFQQRPFE